MKKRRLTVIIAILFLVIPVYAVFNSTDLSATLLTLKRELQDDYRVISKTRAQLTTNYLEQHQKMVDITKECNELSLMLYSQKQDFTFDLCYALEKVTEEYNHFDKDRMPFERIVSNLDIEIDRYAHLIQVLSKLPPERTVAPDISDSIIRQHDTLDSHLSLSDSRIELLIEAALSDSVSVPFLLDMEGEENRDSCIFYASELLKMYSESRAIIIADSIHYNEAFKRLKESYDYSKNYYRLLQRRIFIEGQTPWLTILSDVDRYWKKAKEDYKDKYDLEYFVQEIEKQHDLTYYTDSKFNYTLQAIGVFLIICEILLFWLIAFLLLLPIFRFVKPVKRTVKKGQKRYFALLFAILLLSIFNDSATGNNISGKATSLANTFMWLLAAIITALLIRVKPEQFKQSIKLYRPIIYMAIVVIGCRVVFMPNSMMNFIFPPILILFFCWQLFVCLRHQQKTEKSDRIFSWISLVITGLALIVSIAGYIFAALLILIWWYFQLAVIHTMTTIWYLTNIYKEKHLKQRIDEYNHRITYVSGSDKEALLFGATWFYDLIKSVILPVIALMSIPFCIKLTLEVFDFHDLFNTLFHDSFFQITNNNGIKTFDLSFHKIILLLGLIFVFRYSNKAIHFLWRQGRYTVFLKKNNRKSIRKNEINLSLGNSIISILTWMIYAIIVVMTLDIPTGSLGLIAGGLSAGIGIALKDIINNFVYGIQLMTGRLKIGDWIECDGIRGAVTDINYQSTQVETIDGTTVSFLNSNLFAKNFTNLTKSNSYELLKLQVSVAYGTDIALVREVLEGAMQVMRTKDPYGREVVEPTKGIYVVVGGFGENGVEIWVKQYVLAAERIAYIDNAKEVIYNALKENGIVIPFPQRDIHVINTES